ncbi:hypothetical protein BH09BAC3_BH09BAC3_05660 [soil metagenome]
MRLTIIIILLLAGGSGYAQSLSTINFSYLYKSQKALDFEFHPVAGRDSITFYYTLKGQNPPIGYYVVSWEKRESYGQREGTIIKSADTLRLINGFIEGNIKVVKPEKPWVLAAKVINYSSSTASYFIKQVEAHYPVNGYLERNGQKQWTTYNIAGASYVVRGPTPGKPIHFSYYKDNFPTPSPPFAEKEIKMDRFLFPDSTFTINSGSETGLLHSVGLYLAQEDTLSEQGFSFVIQRSPYPRYNKIAELKGPLLFVTTKDENDQIGMAGEDKTKFDKVILDITSDRDRATVFMRNYFKRVEFANLFFTSFKDGWKTDRGMIFIVYGVPDEVNFNGQLEIWGYRSPRQKFVFTKSGSVYSPEHYVLIRDSGYTQEWYQTIDLWRKSRF